ncbi:hypothetical protein AB1Y20_004775 [Prymnesium parvum]|uniref:Uncharacterized protein n=1 Tax=Prymnesium parvum TaxID=97485 RepID=A0AB34IXR4_PRYPA|mmetsp:Transcript_31686/g.78957  ORF Transcript_31686/g.78957 Transcript_31686/m.78957 type:complete len:215 (-) Transcript_31686:188-832(-)
MVDGADGEASSLKQHSSTASTHGLPSTASAAPAVRWHLFCDLDGVLADFDRGVAALPGARGRAPSELSLKQMWRMVAQHGNFFDSLRWTPDGRDLWRGISAAAASSRVASVRILSGLPAGPLGRRSAEQKSRWCQRELGAGVELITCMTRDKHRYCTPPAVLIDDNAKLRAAWELAGGAFILHQDTPTTLRALESLLAGGSPEDAPVCSNDIPP